MQRELVLTPKFKRAFRKFIRRDPKLRKQIEDTLAQMEQDAFAPALGTHKLSGVLAGFRACVCGYNCRIVFVIERDRESNHEVIVLLDIGTHEEVY